MGNAEKRVATCSEVPMRILDCAREIQYLNPENQEIPYTASNRKRYFRSDPFFNEIIQRFPNKISRGNVKDLSIEAIKDHSQIKKLFLATMIWGFGTVGFGPYRTHKMLNDKHSAQKLEMAVKGIVDAQKLRAEEEKLEEYKRACEDFQLPFCGLAFSTKYFYFVGLGCNAEPLPLILDARVAEALRGLLKNDAINLANFAKVQFDKRGKISFVLHYCDGYALYVKCMNLWARAPELNCKPDCLELFMFKHASSICKQKINTHGPAVVAQFRLSKNK